jgi:exonuclease SbcC
MKIQKIYIKNLNSLAGEHLIDFNKKPLADSSLFAITGPTGSGKSTILDAVCLALYNLSPRQDGTITAPSLTKSGALISKGASESVVWVEYTQENNRYKSKWSIAYNKNGNLNDRKQELSYFNPVLNDWELIETNTKVPARNALITSLDFLQFNRSVLLAQGQFSALLNAAKEERYTLMEKITGDDNYRKIGKKIYETYTTLKNKLEEEKKVLENIQILSQEELNQLQNQFAEIESELKLLKEEQKQKNFFKNIKEQIINNKNQFSKVTAELIIWEQEFNTFQVNRKKLELYDLHHTLLQDLNAIRQKTESTIEINKTANDKFTSLQKQEEQIENKLIFWSEKLQITLSKNSFQEVFSQKLDAIYAAMKDQEDKNRNYQNALTEEQEAQKKYHNSEYEKKNKSDLVTQTKEHLQQVQIGLETFKDEIPLFEKLNEGQIKFDTLVTRRNNLFNKLNLDLKIKLEDAKDLVEKEERNLIFQIEEIQKLGERSTIEQASDQLIQQENYLRQVLFQLDHIQMLENEFHHLKLDNETLNGVLFSLKNQFTSLTEELDQLKNHQAELDEVLALAARVKDLASIREHLVDGEPCPLCGSIHHPGISGLSEVPLQDKRNNYAISIKKCSENLDKIVLQISQNNAIIDGNKKRMNEIITQKEIIFAKEQIQNYFEISENLSASREKIVDSLEENKGKRENIQIIKDKMILMDHLKEKWQKEKEKLGQFQDLENEKTEILAFFREHLKISEFNAIHSSLQILSKKQIECQELNKKYEHLEKELNLNTSLLEEHTKLIRNNLEELHRRKDASQVALILLQEATERLDQFPKIENPMKYKTEELVAMHTLFSDSSKLNEDLMELKRKKEILEKEIYEQNSLFVHNLHKAGFPSPEALESIRLTSEERKEFRSRKDQLDQWHHTLQTNKTNVLEALKNLEIQDNPEIDLSQIIEDLQHLEHSISATFTQKGSITQILETNNLAKNKYEKEFLELEKKKKALRPFDLLNTLIGDAQGKRFNEYAQELTLKRLLQATNQHLALINARYLLDMPHHGENENDLYVIDQYMGNNRRAAKSTLSGGESFLVSLSMALGLSDLASGKAELGNLFIDEGFGSLDPATLERAIAMLEELQYRRGRRIGIISHVSELKERITTQIMVTPGPGGNSTIECV